jgi:hypothetical protein
MTSTLQLKKWEKLYSLVYLGQVSLSKLSLDTLLNSNIRLSYTTMHEIQNLGFLCMTALQNVIPYFILHLVFGLMWWRREIVIVNEEVWGAIEHTDISLQIKSSESESSCGWSSLRDSHSGRLQVSACFFWRCAFDCCRLQVGVVVSFWSFACDCWTLSNHFMLK